MSNTIKQKNQCKRSRKMRDIPTQLNLQTVAEQKILDEFWSGPKRHGNKRKYEAEMKVKDRRSARMQNKQQARKLGEDDD